MFLLCFLTSAIVFRCLIQKREGTMWVLTNDIDLWLCTLERYENVRRINHVSLTKENGNPKKEPHYCQLVKNM